MTAFVRPGPVCFERDRELLAKSVLPTWNPSPGNPPSTSPHRPAPFMEPASSFGRPWSSLATEKFGPLQEPAGIQKSEQIRGVKTAGPKEKPVPNNVRQFVLKHYAEAQKLADSLGNGVTAAEVLAVAGNESGWGDPSKFGGKYGNFFGLHGAGPAGTYWTTGKPSRPVAKFPVSKDSDGFQASGQAFVKLLQGKKVLTSGIGNDPKAFFNTLNKSGLYAVESHGTYAAMMVQDDPHKRGPYKFVIDCISQLKKEGDL